MAKYGFPARLGQESPCNIARKIDGQCLNSVKPNILRLVVSAVNIIVAKVSGTRARASLYPFHGHAPINHFVRDVFLSHTNKCLGAFGTPTFNFDPLVWFKVFVVDEEMFDLLKRDCS